MTGVVTTLDDYGRPAWIGVMVLAFILFWPAGPRNSRLHDLEWTHGMWTIG